MNPRVKAGGDELGDMVDEHLVRHGLDGRGSDGDHPGEGSSIFKHLGCARDVTGHPYCDLA